MQDRTWHPRHIEVCFGIWAFFSDSPHALQVKNTIVDHTLTYNTTHNTQPTHTTTPVSLITLKLTSSVLTFTRTTTDSLTDQCKDTLTCTLDHFLHMIPKPRRLDNASLITFRRETPTYLRFHCNVKKKPQTIQFSLYFFPQNFQKTSNTCLLHKLKFIYIHIYLKAVCWIISNNTFFITSQ